LGAFAAFVVDDLCVVDLWAVDVCAVAVFPFVFLVLEWVDAGFDVASFD
jgi:hypothetical protein